MTVRTGLVRAFVAALLSACVPTFADQTAAQVGPPPWDAYPIAGLTSGWKFRVASTPIQVTSLGLWDKDNNGFLQPYPVAIWDNNRSLVATVTIPAGTSAPLSGGFRYLQIPPVTLQSGQEYMIGFFTATTNQEKMNVVPSFTSFDPSIEYIAAYDGKITATITYPDDLNVTQLGYSRFGPNFTFNVLPEPAPAACVAVGMAALMMARRRTA